MDIILEVLDTYIFDYAYAALLPAHPAPYNLKDGMTNFTSAAQASTWHYSPSNTVFSLAPSEAAYMSAWNRDDIKRQAISLFLITWLAGASVYFIVSTLSYIFVFDKTIFNHPKFLKNQIRMEIWQAVSAMPFIALLTTPMFLCEVLGYSKLYETTEQGPGYWYNWFQFPLFLVFTDFAIYAIHRGLHHPLIYKHFHKAHHKWIMPTPYASVAFDPIDGFLQSMPYHAFPYIFPLQKFAYLGLFFFVQIWTVLIHDGEYVANSPIINGAACHTMHHLYFNFNYGQYTTFWDRIGGTYRKPNEELFRRETKMAQKEWERQAKEMEKMVKIVEGSDQRQYGAEETKKSK